MGALAGWQCGRHTAGCHLGNPVAAREATRGRHYALRAPDRSLQPLQSWPLAYWPDGSLKWTAHALAPGDSTGNGPYEVVAQRSAPKLEARVTVQETAAGIEVDTGKFVCRLPRLGSNVVEAITRGGSTVLRDGQLVLLRQDRGASSGDAQVRQETFQSSLDKVTVEQRGPARAVVKLEGKHSNGARAWLPFTLRLYFYAGSDALRVLHTIVFDGDEIAGLHPRHRPAFHDADHRRSPRPSRALRRR